MLTRIGIVLNIIGFAANLYFAAQGSLANAIAGVFCLMVAAALAYQLATYDDVI